MENFFSILGGMGTMATESFVRLINHRIEAKKDQDYLNYVLFNHATVPDRTGYILDRTKENPMPYLLDDIEKQNLLQPAFIVLTCNTAHYFYDELQQATPIPLLHMPREAAKELAKSQDGGKVAILATEGTISTGVYNKEMETLGFEPVVPNEKLQKKVMDLIYRDIKEKDFLNKELYLEILDETVKTLGCDQIILGCTELSLMEEYAKGHGYSVIDAQAVLAERTIERALALRK